MKILFVAVENGALKGGKVGGVADVVGSLPPVLADLGMRVVVLTPSHGFLHQSNPENTVLENFPFFFRGYEHRAELIEIFPEKPHKGVRHMVIDHPMLASADPKTGRPLIYTDDPPEKPFATDANRFALFCSAASAAVVSSLAGDFDIIHLHDWHTALIAFLRAFSPNCKHLQTTPTVFSIHNLGIQGVRPLRGHSSSLEAWFPEISYHWEKVADPRWPDCVNPMAAGIRLSERVHAVSPTYALEIQKISRKPQFYGGEGLEADLKSAARQKRLIGILNGCDYHDFSKPSRRNFFEMLSVFRQELLKWAGMNKNLDSGSFITHARLLEMEKFSKRPDIILSSVSRIVEQKFQMFLAAGSGGRTGLESILESLGEKGVLIILGSGDPSYENALIRVSSQFDNFLFLNGYSDPCARALYAGGDLFLMPSSYEPCGISQMLAMREGQACVVHRVGGLSDTVAHGENGFSFHGDTLENQVDAFVKTVQEAIRLKLSGSGRWNRIRRNAAASRFSWRKTARRYLESLYNFKDGGKI